MEVDARIRASDADRDRVAAALREHLAAGRLTIEEFGDRLEQAFAAKTLGDLEGLMADLPGADLDQPLEETVPKPPAGPVGEDRYRLGPAWCAVWRPWLVISAFFFVIWLVSVASGGPWFVYPALIAGAVLLLRGRRGPPPRRDGSQVRTHQDHREIGG